MVAASVDPIEDVAALRAGLHVGYPMYGEVDPKAIADATGAFIQTTGDRPPFLHATGFLIDPDGNVVNALYSTGQLGRLTASETIRRVNFALK